MKIARTVESLKHLDNRAVDQLVKGLISTERFELSEQVSPFSMFLLPDGKFLNAVDIWQRPINKRSTSISRDQVHHELYDVIRETDKRIRMTNSAEIGRPMPFYEHPSNDPDIAKYYNIIYLAAWHMAKYAIVPKGVEPTEKQQAILRYLYTTKGFKVDTDGQDDYHLMPAHIYRDYARRKFLNESLTLLRSLNEAMTSEQIENELVGYYGEATNLGDTGFITPSGVCLDFKRTLGFYNGKWDPYADDIIEHDDVHNLFEDEEIYPYDLIMNHGFIRAFGNSGILLSTEPTPKQYVAIKKLAASGFRKHGEFYIDFDEDNYRFDGYLTGKSDEVVKVIHTYFEPKTAVTESVQQLQHKSSIKLNKIIAYMVMRNNK